MQEYTEVTPFSGEVSEENLSYYVYGKSAPPAGFDHYRIYKTDRGSIRRIVALDAAGNELRAWELSTSLAARPALSTVEIQVGIL